MRRAQSSEDDQLHKQFHHLQQDWNSYKQSVPRRHRRRSSSASTTTTTTVTADADANADATPAREFLRLLHNSPKRLISSLQESRTPSARPRPVTSHDAAAERKSAIESGKLRGRSLLDALESAKDVCRGGGEDVCSICSSSVLIQEPDAANSSSCSCCSSTSVVDRRYERGRNACYIPSPSNASSSSSYIEASLGNKNKLVEDEEVVVVSESIRVDNSSSSRSNNNANYAEEWVVRVGWFALALVVFAFGLISYVEFGVEESVEYMIPT